MFNDEILCDASFYIASFRIQIKQYQVILCLTFCYRFWLHVHGIKLLLQSIQHIHKDQITRLAFGLRFISKYTTLNEMLWTEKNTLLPCGTHGCKYDSSCFHMPQKIKWAQIVLKEQWEKITFLDPIYCQSRSIWRATGHLLGVSSIWNNPHIGPIDGSNC